MKKNKIAFFLVAILFLTGCTDDLLSHRGSGRRDNNAENTKKV